MVCGPQTMPFEEEQMELRMRVTQRRHQSCLQDPWNLEMKERLSSLYMQPQKAEVWLEFYHRMGLYSLYRKGNLTQYLGSQMQSLKT